jgi:hypothetical protein
LLQPAAVDRNPRVNGGLVLLKDWGIFTIAVQFRIVILTLSNAKEKNPRIFFLVQHTTP